MIALRSKRAVLAVAAGAAVVLAAAGCSSTASNSAVTQDQGGQSWTIASVGSVGPLAIKGGSISGSTGTLQTIITTIQLSDVSVTDNSMTVNFGSGDATLQATNAGSNVFSGSAKLTNLGDQQVTNLTLSATPPPPPAITYTVARAGTVAYGNMSSTWSITGGALTGSTGTITSVMPFGINVTGASVTATAFTANFGNGTATLTGSNYVYSGTVPGMDKTQLAFSGLQLVAAPPPPSPAQYTIEQAGYFTMGNGSFHVSINSSEIRNNSGQITSSLPFVVNLTNIAATPTAFTASFNGGPATTLSGSGYVYSGSVKAGELTYNFTNLTLKAAS